MSKLRALAAAALAAAIASPAIAATTTFGSQSGFQSALDGSFTLINLDATPYSSNPSGYELSDVAAALMADGLVSIGYDADVVSGQNGQTPTDRDWLITNGDGFAPGTPFHIAFNFVSPVNGVGALSNILGNGDGGRIRVFSGENLGGTLLGQANFGLNTGVNGFGGITSTDLIRSVEITCDFNSDLRCGVYDIQFGAFAADDAIPEPEVWALLILGFGLAGAALRRRGETAALT